MATERPDWVPEGWEWDDLFEGAYRHPRAGGRLFIQNFGELWWQVNGLICGSLETALAIAELLAAERGGWA